VSEAAAIGAETSAGDGAARAERGVPDLARAARAATPGSTILLSPGVHRERLTINKHLVLVGDAPAEGEEPAATLSQPP